ncbi:MAG: pyruvate, water dikinase [Metallosphaera sp.]|uniref:Phosphoenolpyruvate synthase n=1 Tax=Metallosphaera cuprina (strain Ar-4) TaxID=1006006 RepID=F4G0M1_METCR|nr:pyruvate, water dikinase [Metallosphaera cuprina]AEB94640.1 phosphoenolpyruvate synthase [Metallosphaera cuprina Ar-4]
MVTQILKEEGILPLIKVRKEMIELAGGKGANLGELLSQGIRVPPGFVITSKAYSYFLDYNGLREKIISALNLSPDEASKVIKNLILSAKLPPDLEEMINSSYNELANMAGKEVLVAVRSSATAEDIENASFAGQQDTYLNVNRSNIIEAVKLVWASLYNERAIEYRKSKGIDSSKVEMAVVVQKMVNSKSSGVMFTLNPSNGDRNLIVIESSWGLGEAVVGGKVTPDEIVISKSNLKILDKRISKKNLKIVYDKGRNIEVHLEGEESEKPSISDEEALELAKLALKIEAHYGTPMDIEWAIDSDLKFPDNVFIVQARPETFWSSRKKEDVKVEEKPSERKVLVKGLAASPGIASGKARVLLDVKDAKEFQKGEILVTKMTDPDWVPVMKAASAIVTDEGGITSHAAIVSRELGIPAIVGAKEATKVLETGQEITVDATRGVVYDGKIILEEPKQESHTSTGSLGLSRDAMLSLFPVTGTKIYMNLGQPDVIEKYLDLPFDGIGLMRIEFIVSEWIKHHPLYLIKIGKPEEFVNKLADGIARVASAIYPRPVVVRFSDFKTNEYRGLIGGEEFEPEERNPMIGWRGVSRYVSQQYEPAFRLEVRAIRKAREDMGLKNVWVMFPFVRTSWELNKAIKIMEDEGLTRTPDFKVWIMAEVPSVITMADEFSKMVDGFSIGSNDLAQLTLGVDRDSEILGRMGYYDERDPAVLRSMRRLIRVAHKYGRTVSICGQAPSVYPEVTEFLVKEGIDSVSINPDTVIYTRRLVASIEQKILLRGIK